MPVLVLAQEGGIIPCGNGDQEPCTSFSQFLALINNLINFTLTRLALPIAAIMFAYAGFKLVTSGGSEEARSSAKRIFTNTAIGLVLAAGAWLVIKTLLWIAGYQFTDDFFN